MNRFAALTAAALVAAGALGAPKAEARGGGGAVAAGLIGGLAAGALLGAAVSQAAPVDGYGYARPAPVYGYDDPVPPVVRYRPARVVPQDDFADAPVYRYPRRARFDHDRFEGYDRPEGYGYRRAGYGYRSEGYGFGRDCDRPHGDGRW